MILQWWQKKNISLEDVANSASASRCIPERSNGHVSDIMH